MFRSQQIIIRVYVCTSLKLLNYLKNTEFKILKIIPGVVISLSQRPQPDNAQHSQQTNIHAPGGIRTHNLSRRAAEDLYLRPRGH